MGRLVALSQRSSTRGASYGLGLASRARQTSLAMRHLISLTFCLGFVLIMHGGRKQKIDATSRICQFFILPPVPPSNQAKDANEDCCPSPGSNPYFRDSSPTRPLTPPHTKRPSYCSAGKGRPGAPPQVGAGRALRPFFCLLEGGTGGKIKN